MFASARVARDRAADQVLAVSFDGLGRTFAAGKPVLRDVSLDRPVREMGNHEVGVTNSPSTSSPSTPRRGRPAVSRMVSTVARLATAAAIT